MTAVHRRMVVAVVAALLPMAASAGPKDCVVPEDKLETAGVLYRVAAAQRSGGPVKIMVVGSASSGGMGTSGPDSAYPVQLAKKLPAKLKVEVEVNSVSRRGWTAEAMADEMPDLVASEPPHLVVWQTGTVEAVREVSPEAFGASLALGTTALRKALIDVVLVDMQFSPATVRLIDFGPYIDYMNWIAAAAEVPVLHRHAIMRAWSDEQRFGPVGRGKQDQLAFADKIHACIAEALARLITIAADAAPR